MDEKIVNILLDLLNESKSNGIIFKEMNHRFELMDKRFESMDKRLEKLEEHAIRTNAAIGELRISVMRLADELLNVYEMEKRLKIVENIVLNKAS